MQNLIIRAALADDIAEIQHIISHARGIMRETGNREQWNNGYPSDTVLLEDVARKRAYVLEAKQEVVGYFVLEIGQDPEPTYAKIEQGNWLNAEDYGVIHRLATNGKVKGIAQAAFDFAFSQIANVRVDTHRLNSPMRRFLEKANFTYCGVIYLADGSPRDAYQKSKE